MTTDISTFDNDLDQWFNYHGYDLNWESGNGLHGGYMELTKQEGSDYFGLETLGQNGNHRDCFKGTYSLDIRGNVASDVTVVIWQHRSTGKGVSGILHLDGTTDGWSHYSIDLDLKHLHGVRETISKQDLRAILGHVNDIGLYFTVDGAPGSQADVDNVGFTTAATARAVAPWSPFTVGQAEYESAYLPSHSDFHTHAAYPPVNLAHLV